MTEIFVEPELDNLQDADNAEQWFNLCVELGLDKQGSLAEKSKELKAPPYMFLDPRTERIIKTLCPVGVEYKQYGSSTIPLDVLQEIAKCEKNGWYEKISIFSDNKSPDPFVIGEFQDPNTSWRKVRHLIARWGAELVPFEILEERAITRIKDSLLPELEEMKSKMEIAIKNPELFIKGILSGKQAPVLNANIGGLDTFSLPF